MRARVNVGNEEHYVGVISISTTTATINISSDPQQAVFNVGETKTFDVTKDNLADISVKLNLINTETNRASLTIKAVEGAQAPSYQAPIETGEGKKGAGEEAETGAGNYFLLIVAGLIALIIIVLIVVLVKAVRKK